MSLETVETTWKRLGRRIQPMRGLVLVVTDPPFQKVGSLFLPEKVQGFYNELPNMVMVRSTVLSVGPRVSGLLPGARVTFPRTQFIRHAELRSSEAEPPVMVGWIDAAHIAGTFTVEDEQDALRGAAQAG